MTWRPTYKKVSRQREWLSFFFLMLLMGYGITKKTSSLLLWKGASVWVLSFSYDSHKLFNCSWIWGFIFLIFKNRNNIHHICHITRFHVKYISAWYPICAQSCWYSFFFFLTFTGSFKTCANSIYLWIYVWSGTLKKKEVIWSSNLGNYYILLLGKWEELFQEIQKGIMRHISDVEMSGMTP